MNATGTFARPSGPACAAFRSARSYDVETVHGILDAGLVCHVGLRRGRPSASSIPTAYARVGDTVVLHGSSKSRTLLAAAGGAELCVTVTHLDGLVLARSAFHHSVNYRSVVIFGRAAEVTDPARKRELLRAFTERLYPGSLERGAAAERAGAEGHAGRRAAAARGRRQGPDGWADRRRGGHERSRSGPASSRCGWSRARRRPPRTSPARRHPPRWRGRRRTDRARAWRDRRRRARLAARRSERALEEPLDRGAPVVAHEARAGAREVRVRDDGILRRLATPRRSTGTSRPDPDRTRAAAC